MLKRNLISLDLLSSFDLHTYRKKYKTYYIKDTANVFHLYFDIFATITFGSMSNFYYYA